MVNGKLLVSETDGIRTIQFNRPECFASDDFREGVAAFLEKRPPRFGSPAR